MKECFSLHKTGAHYNKVLNEFVGTPYLRLIYQSKGRGKWSESAIDEIEEYFIALAAIRNSNISNKQKTQSSNWEIRGLDSVGRGKSSTYSRELGIDTGCLKRNWL